MKILVACEFSGVVRRAFREQGHDAWSCDLLDSEDRDSQHIKGDCLDIVNLGWELLIAHPPCTYLAISGARWWAARRLEQQDAIRFFIRLASAQVPKIALENPVGCLSTVLRRPDQIIQPWQFGHGETKATCLWLKNLPLLKPTNIVDGRKPACHYMAPSPTRSKDRSRTYEGIARAMAEQWSV